MEPRSAGTGTRCHLVPGVPGVSVAPPWRLRDVALSAPTMLPEAAERRQRAEEGESAAATEGLPGVLMRYCDESPQTRIARSARVFRLALKAWSRARRRAGRRRRCLAECGTRRRAPAHRAVKGPNDSARSNDSRASAAPEVWDPPKKLIATPHEMTTNVMEPGASPRAVMGRSTGSLIFRQKWRAHLNVIEQGWFAGLAPRAIEAFERLRTSRKSATARQQKKERQQHRNVQGNRAKSVPPNRFALFAGKPCVCVIL